MNTVTHDKPNDPDHDNPEPMRESVDALIALSAKIDLEMFYSISLGSYEIVLQGTFAMLTEGEWDDLELTKDWSDKYPEATFVFNDVSFRAVFA